MAGASATSSRETSGPLAARPVNPRAARRWLSAKTVAAGLAGRVAAAASIGSGLAGIAQALAIAMVAAAVLNGDGVSGAIGWLAAAAVAILARAVLSHVEVAAGALAAARIKEAVRSDLALRLTELGPGWAATHRTGETVTILVEAADALDGYVRRFRPAAAATAVVPAMVAATGGLIWWPAGLVIAAGLAIVPAGMALAGLGAAAASRRRLDELQRMSGHFLDRLQALTTLKLFGRAEDEIGRIDRVADAFRQRTMSVLKLAFISSTVLEIAAAGAIASIALLALGIFGAGGGVTTFQAVACLLLASEFFAPWRRLSAAYHERSGGLAAAERLSQLEAERFARPRRGSQRLDRRRPPSVTVEAVGVRFEDGRRHGLAEISFTVAGGERLAVVGPSGVGKSTLMALLAGFRSPDSGRILVEGVDLADIAPESLVELTAYVGQAPTLFAGTIADNIRLAKPGATVGEVEDAARSAGLDMLIATLPKGLQSAVGERGVGLSGGEARRVALARAFLKDAPLLLLDEPTASLDRDTEATVVAAIDRLAKGRTVIVATHSEAVAALCPTRITLSQASSHPAETMA